MWMLTNDGVAAGAGDEATVGVPVDVSDAQLSPESVDDSVVAGRALEL
jgi:hypothetical protein